MTLHLGIDLGGTKTEIIALDSSSTSLFRKRIASPQGKYQETLKALINLVLEAEQYVGKADSLGIGIPGALSTKTGLIKNANSTWLIGQDLKSDLSRALSRKIAIANDADCFTLSEAVDGAGKNQETVFGIILGTGVGGGIAINQHLVSGPNAICGEWGHNPLPWKKPSDEDHPCYCGQNGCIETFLSGPGMLRHYQAQCTNAQSPEDIISLAQKNDTQALSYFSQFMDRLGRSVASVINVLDPHIVILGGGLSNINEIYDEIAEHVKPYIFSDSVNTEFARARHGDASGVRGAAWLGKQYNLNNEKL